MQHGQRDFVVPRKGMECSLWTPRCPGPVTLHGGRGACWLGVCTHLLGTQFAFGTGGSVIHVMGDDVKGWVSPVSAGPPPSNERGLSPLRRALPRSVGFLESLDWKPEKGGGKCGRSGRRGLEDNVFQGGLGENKAAAAGENGGA